MRNIVYLLGAGASAQALPLVSDFNIRLKIFYDFLQKAKSKNLRQGDDILDKDLLSLIIEEENHFSIDTLAKKYKLSGSEKKYEKVKALMTCFFTYESFKKSDELKSGEKSFLQEIQSERMLNDNGGRAFDASQRTIDLRYDALLAAIINNPAKVEIPQNVKFLSWNYDDQLETAGQNMLDAGKEFKLLDRREMVKVMSGAFDKMNSSIDLIKLNGGFLPSITAIKNETVTQFYQTRKIQYKNIFAFDELYRELLDKPFTVNISFAWEMPISDDNRIKQAKEFIKDASDLVVIGYSFPNYNVEVDQYLFEGKVFRNVYIEDIAENYENLIERLDYLKINTHYLKEKNLIKHHKDLKSFCLPPSFYVAPPKPARSLVVGRKIDNSY